MTVRDAQRPGDDFLRLSLLIRSMYAAVLVEDEFGRIVLTNPSFCDLFKIPVPPEALIGADCSTAAEHNKSMFVDAEGFVLGVAARLRSQAPVRGEILRRVDGRILERDYIPIFQESLYRGHLWVYRDVTEREAARQALADARDEAEARSRRNRAFAATLSHEVRTPMNAVAGIVDVLMRGELGPEQRRLIKALDANTRNILAVLNHVLDLSSAEAQPVFEGEACDIESLVLEVVAAFEVMAEERGLRLYALCAPDIPKLAIDAVRLRQVLVNLLGNALKFTTDGEVSIRAYVEASALCVDVVDSGPGIAPEAQARIFEAYEQADASVEARFGGTGLGLAISRRFVAALRGTLSVKSTVGIGSTFTVRLPLGAFERRPQRTRPLEGTTVTIEGKSPDWHRHAEQVMTWSGARVVARGNVRIIERLPIDADALCSTPKVYVGVRNAARVCHALQSPSVFLQRAPRNDRLVRAVLKARGLVRNEATDDLPLFPMESRRKLTVWAPPDASRAAVVQRLQRTGYHVSVASDLGTTWEAWLEDEVSAILVDERVPTDRRDELVERLRCQSPYRLIEDVVVDFIAPRTCPDTDAATELTRLVAKVGRNFGCRVVLVADDDPDNRMVVGRYLHGSGRYAPLEAPTVAAAQALLQVEEVTAVVSDLYFGRENGLALARYVRARPELASIPLVALTGAKNVAKACLRAGFNAVLQKPVCATALLGVVDDLLEPTRASVVVDIDPEISDLVPVFLSSRQRDLDAVTDDIVDERFDRIFDVGHKVKGSGAAYGFTELSELGGRLERAGQDRDPLEAWRALLQIQRYLEVVEVRVKRPHFDE